MLEVDPDRDPLDLLAEEFADRWRHGEQPTVTEYAEKYPDLAEDLREVLPPVAKMEQLKRLRQAQRLAAEEPRLQSLGDYRILREIGRGGMGIVYEAVQESLGRHVALKVLPRHAHLEPTKLERFQREAQAAARLHHTNIVPVFGVGAEDGLHYYVMQFIEGRSLNEVLRNREDTAVEAPTAAVCKTEAVIPLPPAAIRHPRSVARIGIQAAQALHYAHQQGLLHRDIKPANLLLDDRGAVWVTDFGLAKWTDQKGVTHTGDVVGTLHYLAPESLHDQADARSDVYSLGLTLYELLTLQLPFNDPHPAGVLRQMLDQEPRPPRYWDPSIPRDLETIVLKAMAREPAQRYQTAADLADDLQRFLEDRPIQARRATALERGWRWCRRNRALASLSAATLLSLLLAAVSGWVGYASTVQALEREAAKSAEAEAATKRAQDNVELSLRKFEEMFNHIAQRDRGTRRWGEGPPMPFGPPPSEEDAALFMSILSFYDRFAESNATNPGLQREAAKAHRRAADIYQRLGQLDKADAANRRAAAIYEQLVRDFPQSADYRRELAEIYVLSGSRSTEAAGEVEARLRRALVLAEGLPDGAEITSLRGRIHGKLGAALQQRGRTAEAEQAYRESVELNRTAVAGGAAMPAGFDLALARHSLAAFLLKQDRPGEARTLLDESIADLQALPTGGSRHRWSTAGRGAWLLALHYESLADACTRLGDTDRAREAAQKAKELTGKPMAPRPGPPREGKGPAKD